MQKAFMMVDHCTQREQNPLNYFKYVTTNIQHLLNNGHKSYILAQSQGIFYLHQVPVVFDYWNKYETKSTIRFWDSTTNIQF